MSNGPIPSTLVLLPTLHEIAAGAKVRFLGCVESYTAGDATLTLEHDGAAARALRVRALVDVKLLLQSLKAEQTRPGQWVNVIGYVAADPDGPHPPGPGTATATATATDSHHVRVQAVMLWSAGPLNVHEYASAVAAKTGGARAT